VSAADEVLVVTIGWTELVGQCGICAPCSHKSWRLARPNSRLERTQIGVERSARAVTISRALARRSRSST
jgi:hypothetical protein